MMHKGCASCSSSLIRVYYPGPGLLWVWQHMWICESLDIRATNRNRCNKFEWSVGDETTIVIGYYNVHAGILWTTFHLNGSDNWEMTSCKWVKKVQDTQFRTGCYGTISLHPDYFWLKHKNTTHSLGLGRPRAPVNAAILSQNHSFTNRHASECSHSGCFDPHVPAPAKKLNILLPQSFVGKNTHSTPWIRTIRRCAELLDQCLVR